MMRRRGLTLAETVVVAGVFALLTLTITQLLSGSLRAWNKAQIRNKLRGDVRAAVDLISAEFRQNSTPFVSMTFPGTSAPSTPSVGSDNRLSFNRFDNDGSTYTVTYTIDDAAKTLSRFDSKTSTTTIIAENVVGLDPANTLQRKSYFQWDQTHTCMNINLTVADYQGDPASITSGSSFSNRENVTLKTSAYYIANTASSGNPAPATINNTAPLDLRDPRWPHT